MRGAVYTTAMADRLTRRRFLAASAAVTAAGALAACRPAGAEAKTLTVMHLADIHGKLRPHPELFYRSPDDASNELKMVGGIAEIAAFVKKVRTEKGARSLLVYEGDTFHSSGLAVLSYGKGLLPAVNALGIDAYCPGNWDWAIAPPPAPAGEKAKRNVDMFLAVMAEMTPPVVGYNARPAGTPIGAPFPHPKTGEPILKPYVMKDAGGVKVGIIGLTSVKIPKEMAPAVSDGVAFEYLDTAPVRINAFAKELRDQGAQLVFLLSENGLNQDVKLAGLLNGVDAIFGGETHERTYKPVDVRGTLVLQSGSEGSTIGQLDIVVKDGGGIASYTWKLHDVVEGFIAPDPEMKKIIDAAYAPYPQLAAVIGKTTTPIMRNSVLETSMDDLIADAIEEKTKADFAVSRGFRYAHPIAAGDITTDDLFEMFPVNPKIRTGKVSTAQILTRWEDALNRVFSDNAFEQSGGWLDRPSASLKAVIVSKAPNGERVQTMAIKGKTIYDRVKGGIVDPGPWTIAACAREGDPPNAVCFIQPVLEPKTLEARSRDTIGAYITAHSPVAPRIEGRVVATDLPKVLRTQFKG